MDDELEKLLRGDLSRINSHLPRARKTLRELLGERDPHVVLLNGSRHYFRRDELERLASIIPEEEWDRIRLPIIIEVSSGLDKGPVGIIRDPVAARYLSRITGAEYSEGKPLLLYAPQLSHLRSIFETVTEYAFTYVP